MGVLAAVHDHRLTKTPMQGFGGEFWTMPGDRLADWPLKWRSYPVD